MINRPIFEIAAEIAADWKKPYFGAVPYIDAMYRLKSIDDMFFFDDARSIVRYFLANSATWKGDKAKAIKAELKEMLK
jgi:hypothetical protein